MVLPDRGAEVLLYVWQRCVCRSALVVLVALAAAPLRLALALNIDAVLAAQRAGLEATALLLARVLERQVLRAQKSVMSAGAMLQLSIILSAPGDFVGVLEPRCMLYSRWGRLRC
jgi:hypothetical protein